MPGKPDPPAHGLIARRTRARQVLMLEAMSIDRGACIKDFSQYPGEVLACACLLTGAVAHARVRGGAGVG